MEKEKAKEESITTLKDLYPYLTDEEIKESEKNLERYLDVILRIFKRIHGDSEDTILSFDSLSKSYYDGSRKVESHLSV